jgi:hypothetical protein
MKNEMTEMRTGTVEGTNFGTKTDSAKFCPLGLSLRLALAFVSSRAYFALTRSLYIYIYIYIGFCLRTPLELHFELICGLLAKWLSGGLWSFILSYPDPSWPNGSQKTFGASF